MEHISAASLLVLSATALVVAMVASSKPNLFRRLTGPPEALTYAWLVASLTLNIGLSISQALVPLIVFSAIWRFTPRRSKLSVEVGFVAINLVINLSRLIAIQQNQADSRSAAISATMAVVLGTSFAAFGLLSSRQLSPVGAALTAASLLASTEVILRILRPTPGIELVFTAPAQDAPGGVAALLTGLALVVIAGTAPRQTLGMIGAGLAALDFIIAVGDNGPAAQTLILTAVSFTVIAAGKAERRPTSPIRPSKALLQ